MSGSLKNQVALVTGGGQGNCKALYLNAKRF